VALELPLKLGPGLDPEVCGEAVQRLCADPYVKAVLAFGSRARGQARSDSDLDLAVIVDQPTLTPTERSSHWCRLRKRIGLLGTGVDLIVAGSADAERLSGSRWHVLADVARHGRVLYVAG
jgi:predicted nucleotidyltransferase